MLTFVNNSARGVGRTGRFLAGNSGGNDKAARSTCACAREEGRGVKSHAIQGRSPFGEQALALTQEFDGRGDNNPDALGT
jgi:hypothetical protein